MKELQKQLDMLIRKSGADMQVIEMIRNEPSVFPFSTEGKLMAYLLAGRIITYEEYLNLNREYNRRNQYLYLFDMLHARSGRSGERITFCSSSRNL